MLSKRRNVLFLIFALSGFSGLIYESIWTHYLKLFLGHAAYAQALVLAIFMGGMAIGSWLCSRYSLRWNNLLMGYAIVEFIIGLFALLFHPAFEMTVRFSYSSVLPQLGTSGSMFYKWIIMALMILPQTILLGMTFPLMAAGLMRMSPKDTGRSISMLYFTNSLGAAIGVLTSGFFLIRQVGLPWTIVTAGVLNIAVAGFVSLITKGTPAVGDAPVFNKDVRKTTGDAGWRRLLIVVSLITGMASFIYEIGWIRMLNLVLGSSTHAFELMLSAFIFGLAFGGLWIRRRIERVDTVRFLAVVQIIMGMLALSTLVLYGNTFAVMKWLTLNIEKTNTGYAWFNLSSNGIALAIMFPATFCAGMTLPLITYSLIRRGHGEASIGAVYAANTAGAILGVFFAIHLGMTAFGLKGLLMFGAGLDMALGAALIWAGRTAFKSRSLPAVVTAACLTLLSAAGFFVELDSYKMASGVYRTGLIYPRNEAINLVFHKDGKTATVSQFLVEGSMDIRTNGKVDASIMVDPYKPPKSDESTMTLLAALPMALRPNARTVANIGFGSGLTASTLLANKNLERVDNVEIENVMFEAARNFGPRVEAAFTDPRSKVYFEDAKTFFSINNKKYDLIISEPSNPWVSGVSGLFSGEFYRLLKNYLTPEGLFCQWLQLYEIDVTLVSSVLKAMSENFPDYVIYAPTNTDMIIIASAGKPVGDMDPSIFNYPGLVNALRRIYVNNMQDLAMRRIGSKKIMDKLLDTFEIRANSDYYPVLDQNAARALFLDFNALDLLNFSVVPLPAAEIIEGEMPAWQRTGISTAADFNRANAVFLAMAFRDYFTTGEFSREYQAIPGAFLNNAVNLGRLFSDECTVSPDQRIAALFDTLGLQMVPHLRPVELEAVWEKLETGSCFAFFTEREKKWISLFKAVGRRDPKAISEVAGELLRNERQLPPMPTGYLVMAGMLGHLAQGNREESFRLWTAYQSRIEGMGQPDLLLNMLVSMTLEGSGLKPDPRL